MSHGTYIQRYGAVFLSEMNLAVATGSSPSHPICGATAAGRSSDRHARDVGGFSPLARLASRRRASGRGSVALLLEVNESPSAARANRDARAEQSAIAQRRAGLRRIRRVLSNGKVFGHHEAW